MQWNLEESDLTMAPADGLDTEYRSAGPGAGLALRLMGPERLYVGNTASLGLVDHSFTIEAWIKIADWADHDQTIVGRYCHPDTRRHCKAHHSLTMPPPPQWQRGRGHCQERDAARGVAAALSRLWLPVQRHCQSRPAGVAHLDTHCLSL